MDWIALTLILAAGTPTSTSHLCTPEDATAALVGAANERQRHLQVVDDVLSTPDAERAAAYVGVTLGDVKRVIPSLSDTELRDLSSRMAALDQDPIAGVKDKQFWIVIALIVFVVPILVLVVAL